MSKPSLTHWTRYIELMRERPELFIQSPTLPIIVDEDTIHRFEEKSGRTIGVVYESRFNILIVDLVTVGTSATSDRGKDPLDRAFCYERIVPKYAGGVVIIPLLAGKFVLLRQFRHAIRMEQYAFPRGYGEPGIPPEENLSKELQEEIGTASVQNVRHLGKIAPDSGISGGIIDIFSCDVGSVEKKIGYEEIEDVVLLDDSDMQNWIAQGRITDGFTLGAYALYKAMR